MCSPNDLATLNDAQAARTVVEMELDTLLKRLDRYDTAPEVLKALRAAQAAVGRVKTHQAALYTRMAKAHRERIEA